MRFAYADPPYLGCCNQYGHYHGDGTAPWDDMCWDDTPTHRLLLEYLDDNYDGWAYCMTSQSLRHIIPATDDIDYRVASWVKPFAAFKANVRIAYTWEPVLFSPGRDRSIDGAPVGRDHLSESITLRRGFTGAKPDKFNRWILDLIGYMDGRDDDQIDDLFPGTAGMARTLLSPPLGLTYETPPLNPRDRLIGRIEDALRKHNDCWPDDWCQELADDVRAAIDGGPV